MESPFVSIVVGVRNEETYITECLESLLNQEYPKNCYEIIIVDGMSTDNTQNIVKQFPVKLILNEKKNVAAARNIGVKAAKGDFVCFTDGDCKANPFWLKTLIKEMIQAKKNVACVGGPNLIFDTDPTFAIVVGYAQETLLGSGGSAQANNSSKNKYVLSLPNCNALYKKNIIEKAGYFDENFIIGQDGDLNHRIREMGNLFLYTPEAIVWHHRRSNVKSFSIRMFKYGAWMAELFKKHRSIVRWYALLPPIAIIYILITIVSVYKTTVLAQVLIAFTFIYFILLLITTFQVINKMKSMNGLLTFLILPLQHVMYGFGFLSRIFKI